MVASRHNTTTFIAFACPLGFISGFYLFDNGHFFQLSKPAIFLLVITYDQSWSRTSFAGYSAVKTPTFSRIAKEGVYFESANSSAPTCTASRSTIFAGQNFWHIGSAGVLGGEFPPRLETCQKTLADHGCKTGYTGTVCGPIKSLKGNPTGQYYDRIKKEVDPTTSTIDHLENLTPFLQYRKPEQPFSLWISPTEPHRAFRQDISVESGEIDLAKAVAPPFLPEEDVVRRDIADYLYEMHWFNQGLAKILQLLADEGELENAVIVYKSDNGMPFAHAKSNNYEYGTHVPLAVRWGKAVKQGLRVPHSISLADLASSYLDLAGISTQLEMTWKSFKAQLLASKSGRIDENRNAAYSGFQHHINNARIENRGYPSWAFQADHYLLIEKLAPDRWTAGGPPLLAYIDDGSPSKNMSVSNKDQHYLFWELATRTSLARNYTMWSNIHGKSAIWRRILNICL